MLKVIDNSSVMTINEASNKYKGYYYLMIISDRNDAGTNGTIQAISDQDSVDELVDMEDQLLSEGKEVLIGSGDDGTMEDLEIVGTEVYG